jgi:hypothetical protein
MIGALGAAEALLDASEVPVLSVLSVPDEHAASAAAVNVTAPTRYNHRGLDMIVLLLLRVVKSAAIAVR